MAENETKKVKKADTKSEKTKKPSKVKAFLKSLKGEFKKIVWAAPKSTFKNTAIVIVCAVAMAVVIGLLDWGFTAGFNFLGKII